MAPKESTHNGLVGTPSGNTVANNMRALADDILECSDRLKEQIAKTRAAIDNYLKIERSTSPRNIAADPLQEPLDMDHYASFYMRTLTNAIEKRLANLSLDLHKYRGAGRAQTKQELLVQASFPDAFLQSDADQLGICGVENEVVVIPKNLRLVVADHTTLDKVRRIQILLARARVPYEYWPMRIGVELEGDFYQVARFIRYSHPKAIWMDFLEAVIQILVSYHVTSWRLDRSALLRGEY